MANFDLALDLGSDFINVITKTNDVLIKQHNLVALNSQDENEILACGNIASKLFKNNPDKVKLVRPIDEFNIKNQDWFNCYFNWLFSVVNKTAFEKQNARILCVVPSGATSNEKKNLELALTNLGAKTVVFVESPKVFAKLVEQKNGTKDGIMLDVGSNIADFGCFVDGQMTSGCSLYLGGKQIDVGIKQFVQQQYNLHIDLFTAEKIKKQYSLLKNNVGYVLVEGTNFSNHHEESVQVPLREFFDVIAHYVGKYCGVIKSMLNSSDIVLAEKIKLGGVFVCGGLSQLEGVGEYISINTGLDVKILQDGANAVIYGARCMLDQKIFDR